MSYTTKKRKRTYTPSSDISLKNKCEHVRRHLNNMHNDYIFLNDLTTTTKNMDIDLYELKKKNFIAEYFPRFNNAKEWYYKIKDLDNCFTKEELDKYGNLFQLLQIGEHFDFDTIRSLQKGRQCRDECNDCMADTCTNNDIEHRITFIHKYGPIWVLYIQTLLNTLKPIENNSSISRSRNIAGLSKKNRASRKKRAFRRKRKSRKKR